MKAENLEILLKILSLIALLNVVNYIRYRISGNWASYSKYLDHKDSYLSDITMIVDMLLAVAIVGYLLYLFFS